MEGGLNVWVLLSLFAQGLFSAVGAAGRLVVLDLLVDHFPLLGRGFRSLCDTPVCTQCSISPFVFTWSCPNIERVAESSFMATI